MTKAKGAQGFQAIKGKRIVKIDARCVNAVKLYDEEGRVYVIEAEVENGIPVMKLKKIANHD